MWSSFEFQAKPPKVNVKPASFEFEELLDEENNIPLTWKKKNTISKQE